MSAVGVEVVEAASVDVVVALDEVVLVSVVVAGSSVLGRISSKGWG